MLNFMKIVIGIFIIAHTASPVLASGEIQVTLELFPEVQNARMLFLSDFDLLQLGTGPLMFRISMINSGNAAKTIIGRFSVETASLGTLFYGETHPFTLPQGTLYLTNHDLFSRQQTYSLSEYNFEAAADELRDIILQTGQLPADRYDFKWEIFDVNNNTNQDSKIESLFIDNPTRLDLISPGAEASGSYLPFLYTTFPYFRWESNATEFRLKVCEKLPHNHSPEDAMNNTPRLETTITGSTFFQYPSAGALNLEEGKTYFWQIFVTIATASGRVEVPSEIWGFQVVDLSNPQFAENQEQLLESLQDILGEGAITELFGPDGELQGFQITGVAFWNGKPITMQTILEIIDAIRDGKLQVESFRIE